MKILIVCSHRNYASYTEYMAPFIYEQIQGLKEIGCDFRVCFVKGGGLKAYIQAWRNMQKLIKEFKPDIIHAHYGLCCLLANMQRKVSVVSTYHGSDINNPKVRMFSKIAIRLSKINIFVSKQLYDIAKQPKKSIIIPCGVDTNLFCYHDKVEARRQLGWKEKKHYVLFSKMFTDPIKNYPLAKAAIDHLKDVELVEFIGYTRQESVLLYNAVDAVIMTSFTEGSPQFIKEALACNTPIVSVNVGDVATLINGVDNCQLCSYDAISLSNALDDIFKNNRRTYGHEQIIKLELDNNTIIHKIKNVYDQVAN